MYVCTRWRTWKVILKKGFKFTFQKLGKRWKWDHWFGIWEFNCFNLCFGGRYYFFCQNMIFFFHFVERFLTGFFLLCNCISRLSDSTGEHLMCSSKSGEQDATDLNFCQILISLKWWRHPLLIQMKECCCKVKEKSPTGFRLYWVLRKIWMSDCLLLRHLTQNSV